MGHPDNTMISPNKIEITSSTLYIVPTPIGHFADITYRALDVLANVDIIAAEDTRRTGLLLQHFMIKTTQLAFHDHNEQSRVNEIIHRLQQGQSIALVSDAGTPLINDPGYHLVNRCRAENIRVVPLPGACAAITALSAAGLPTDRFCYEGFLPAKRKSRCDKLSALSDETRTLIFYESTHRIIDSLQDMLTVWGTDRYIVLARELTKTWETIYGAPVIDLLKWIQEDENRYKGEMVLIVKGAVKNDTELTANVLKTLALLQQELPLKKAAALTAAIHGLKKNRIYQYAIAQQAR